MANNKHASELSFGDRLRAVRKARGLTQSQLADKAGVTQCLVSTYERNAALPGLAVFEWLCIALGVPSSELIGF